MFSRFKSSLARVGFAAVMAGTSAAAIAEDESKTASPEIVERHIVILVDVSQSVDATEYGLMMEGIARGLITDAAKEQFDSGAHYALSTVFFWGGAQVGHGTTIIRNSKEAEIFANEAFFDFATGKPYSRPYNSVNTSFVSAYVMASKIFKAEPFVALSREVLVVADGVENSYDRWTLEAQKVILAQTYGAAISGVPILVSPDAGTGDDERDDALILTEYFQQQVITPAKMTYNDNYGYSHTLKPGRSYPAKGFSGIEDAVGYVVHYALN